MTDDRREARWTLIALGEVLAAPFRALGLWSLPFLLWFGVHGGLAWSSPGFGRPPATMAWPVACGLLIGALLQRRCGPRRGPLLGLAALAPVLLVVVTHARSAVDPSISRLAYTRELWPSLLVLMATLEWMRTPRSARRGLVLGLASGLFLAASATWDRGAELPHWGRTVVCAAALLGLAHAVRSRVHPSLPIAIAGIFAVGFVGVAPSGVPVDGPRVALGAAFVVCAALAAERIAQPRVPPLDAHGVLATAFHRRATWFVPVLAFLVTTAGLVVLATGSRHVVHELLGWEHWDPDAPSSQTLVPVSFAWAVLPPLAVAPVVFGVSFHRARIWNWGLPAFAVIGALISLLLAPLGFATLTSGAGDLAVAIFTATVVLGLAALVVGGVAWAVAGRFRSARVGVGLATIVGLLAGMDHAMASSTDLALGSAPVLAPFVLGALSRSEARARSLVLAAGLGAATVAVVLFHPRGVFVGVVALDAAVLGAILAIGAAAGRSLRSLTPVPDDHAIREDFAGPKLPEPPDALATSP